MPATLDTILAATRRRVARVKAQADVRQLERQAEEHLPRGFGNRLRQAVRSGVAVIAELKKASPSRGTIRADFDAAQLAAELHAAGASALSVLTDEEFFQGSLENLRLASSHAPVPCLRKDFIVDEFQLVESRANHADAVLLIVAALKDIELGKLHQGARELNLDVLCEVHDEAELDRALAAGCGIIGVNSRNLRTFEVDLQTPLRLAARLPAGTLAVAESGIHSPENMQELGAAGYKAFLVGEWLMKAPRPGEALSELLGQTQGPATHPSSHPLSRARSG
ncbi:MAG TPA: indole-3-glycerol phosphate synthase TrpC [Terriglobales bacterium]|nr:indole-3-glycerol phosphate synthase TrpC [Terriglobales bacterium]